MSHESECTLNSLAVIVNQSSETLALDLLEHHILIHSSELDIAIDETIKE